MKLEEISELIFQAVPEFQSFNQEDLDEGFYYSFLDDFGIFTREAIVANKPYAVKCLDFINNIVNKFQDDEDFMEKMQVSVLETLTDFAVTQRAAMKHFTGNCLRIFTGLLTGGYFNDLTNIP